MSVNEASPLAARARRLTSLARDLSGAQEATQSQARTRTALNNLDAKVLELKSQVQVWEALSGVGITLPKPPDLQKDVRDLQEYISSSGRPSPERLRGASRRIETKIQEMASVCVPAWQAWAQAQLGQVEISKVPLVPQPRQSQISLQISTLSTDAKSAPTVSAVRGFALTLSVVMDELGSITSSSDAESSGLAKLTSMAAVPLSDFSRDEILALHGRSDLANQILLRRR